jgi:hypothetical protein
MFDLWLGLPAWLRLVLALIMFGIGAAICWWFDFRVGLIFVCLGMAMLFVGGASDSEKKGYRSL